MSETGESTQRAVRRRMTANFSGRVQGVGFRFTTVEIARDFPVAGYVQNMVDGSVKVVAEGCEEDLLRFLDRLRASHVFRYVTQESLSWSPALGDYVGFAIRYA